MSPESAGGSTRQKRVQSHDARSERHERAMLEHMYLPLRPPSCLPHHAAPITQSESASACPIPANAKGSMFVKTSFQPALCNVAVVAADALIVEKLACRRAA